MIVSYLIQHKRTIGTIVLMVLLVVLSVFATWYVMRPKGILNDTPDVVADAVIKQDTAIEVIPKTSKTDNDLEVTQHYKATVNGATVEVPIKTIPSTNANPNGNKAIVKQEIDITKVVNSVAAIERDKAKGEFKKNWEISTGIGKHGDWYIPVELQRNYTTDKAISIEVHLGIPDIQKVEGVEIKHKWLF